MTAALPPEWLWPLYGAAAWLYYAVNLALLIWVVRVGLRTRSALMFALCSSISVITSVELVFFVAGLSP